MMSSDNLVGKKVLRNNMHKQNNFSMFWTAEALLECYRLTSNKEYLDYGQRTLDELLMTQASWQPPYMYVNVLGGFGVLVAKYMSGTTLPIICPHTVAAAAPAMPRRNTNMRRKSSTMLVIPASTETSRPRFCFSAVVRKL